MKYFWIFATLFSSASLTYADDSSSDAYIAETLTPQPTPQQVVPAAAPQVPVSPQYDNRFGFTFDRLVYERTQIDNMYFGLDVWWAAVWSHNRHNHFGALFEAEARAGYNLFYNGRDHFTPMVGTGYMFHNVGSFHRAKFAYVTTGFLYYHEFNTVFGWGFNLKGLAGQQVGKKEARKFAWGVDFSLPIVFRFAHYRHWDITLEPYYLYMESNHRHQGVFGGRGTVGYRF